MAITRKRVKKLIKKSLTSLGYYTKPDFLIIGAQKAGTSALFSILKQHPQILAPAIKEIHFFDDGLMKFGDFPAYHALFPLPYEMRPNKLTFEATPSYLYHPKCPRRIYQYYPAMKLVVVLRDPVARAFSAWNMYNRFQYSQNAYYRSLADPRSFEDAVMQDLEKMDETTWATNKFAYIKRGVYIEQLESYCEYFSRDAILILEQKELLSAPELVLNQLCSFLQVDNRFAFNIIRSNVSTYKSEIPENVRKTLHAVYEQHNKKLFKFLGKEFPW